MEDEDVTFEEVMEEIKKFRDKRDWKQFHTPKNLPMAIATEAGELMEHFLWDTQKRAEEKAKSEDKIEEIRDELADILIFSFLMAETLDEDVSDLMTDKLDKNKEKYPEERARGNSKKYTEL